MLSELYIIPVILHPSEVQFFSTLFHKATVSEVSGGLVRDKVKDFLQFDFIFSLSGINLGDCSVMVILSALLSPHVLLLLFKLFLLPYMAFPLSFPVWLIPAIL